jgi:hypothetical protein
MSIESDVKQKSRGFAAMNSDRQREIASKGGKAAHERGTAHEFSADEARSAGRKGGERVSADRAHMALIGRLGGKRSAGRRAEAEVAASAPAVAEVAKTEEVLPVNIPETEAPAYYPRI